MQREDSLPPPAALHSVVTLRPAAAGRLSQHLCLEGLERLSLLVLSLVTSHRQTLYVLGRFFLDHLWNCHWEADAKARELRD